MNHIKKEYCIYVLLFINNALNQSIYIYIYEIHLIFERKMGLPEISSI